MYLHTRPYNKIDLSIIDLVAFFKIGIWCGIYKILLEYVYVNFLVERWSFYNFSYETPSVYLYVGSWFITLLVAICLTQLMKLNSFSSIVIQSLVILTFIPGIVLYTYMEQNIYFLYIVYWFFLIVFYFWIGSKKVKPIYFMISENILVYISIFIFLLSFFMWSVFARFHLQLDLINVYEQRAIASNFGAPLPLRYLFGGFQTCIPFLSVWALNNKKYSITFILLLSQILFFFSQGSKSTFLALGAGLLAYKITKRKNQHLTLKILQGMSFLTFSSMIESFVLESNFLLDYMIRRMMFLPNLLNIFYYDFFSIRELDFFRSSILRFIITEPAYGDKIQKIIGGVYFDRPNMYTNNGLFSDAYMNLGIFGLIIMPLMIVLLLRVFDICIGEVNKAIMIGSICYIVFALTGSSFFTNIFSHGFFFLAVVFCFLNKKDAVRIRLLK